MLLLTVIKEAQLVELLRKLEQVQELDFQISLILRKKAEFPKRLAAYEQELKTHDTKYNERKKILDEIEKNLRQQKGALELNESRAKRSQEKLELIKTNQEYQALQKEIESLKKNSAVIQENADKVAKECEEKQKELQSIETVMNEIKAKRDQEMQVIGQDDNVLNSDLERLNAEREKAIQGIDKRYLVAYEKIRDSKFGIGIVRAVEGNCKGCNMRIPPQVYIEIQKNLEVHTCPSCKRILVFYKEGAQANAGTNQDSDFRSSAHS